MLEYMALVIRAEYDISYPFLYTREIFDVGMAMGVLEYVQYPGREGTTRLFVIRDMFTESYGYGNW